MSIRQRINGFVAVSIVMVAALIGIASGSSGAFLIAFLVLSAASVEAGSLRLSRRRRR